MGLPKLSEDEEQKMLMDWAEAYKSVYPELRLLFHIPNGGKRLLTEAKRLKAQGVKPGVPDLCLPVARRNCHGLYIEMKVRGNKPTKLQEKWLEALDKENYAVAVCYSCKAAKRVIMHYLQKE